LDIYFETIDPFDDGGQFIDRGSSYQLAVFYQDEIMKNTAENVIKNMFNKPTAIKLFQEKEFYLAEEFHQDYAIKNPEEIEKEFIISGRNNKK
jgi:peptide-methionine (S)-S-oxide reductase